MDFKTGRLAFFDIRAWVSHKRDIAPHQTTLARVELLLKSQRATMAILATILLAISILLPCVAGAYR